MYSKETGNTGVSRGGFRPADGGRGPYRRAEGRRVQVPPNYSGHAIVDGEERPLGVLYEAAAESPSPREDLPTPRFEGLPRVSELGESHRRQPRTLPASFEVRGEAPSLSGEEAAAVSPSRAAVPAGSGVGAAMPSDDPSEAEEASAASAVRPSSRGWFPLFDASRFPFGHGIGLEELLLLGLILFLLHECGDGEERGDLDETVVLLGLLLLLG